MTGKMPDYVNRMLQRVDQSFFLFGPRGTGKTTWVEHEYLEAYSISLLDEGLYQRYLADPSLFRQELRAQPEGAWIFVDEIQRLPNLLNEVHHGIEARHQRFILTGSSARKLKRADVNLLAGRALQRRLYPFLPSELGSAYSLDTVLRYGSIPLVWVSPDREQTLRAYVEMYLREEIKAEALVRNLAGFARFLPIAGLSHGQAVNTSNIAREAGVSRTTVNGHLEILEDTLLVFRIPAFAARLRVRERKHPKLYWCDPGLARTVVRRSGEVSDQERGILFEGIVATMLKAFQGYRDVWDDISYWSPAEAAQTEVDFVLSRAGQHVGIEVKATDRVGPQHGKGLRAIRDLKGLRRRVIVYLGDRIMRTDDGIDVLPLSGLAAMLESGELWKGDED